MDFKTKLWYCVRSFLYWIVNLTIVVYATTSENVRWTRVAVFLTVLGGVLAFLTMPLAKDIFLKDRDSCRKANLIPMWVSLTVDFICMCFFVAYGWNWCVGWTLLGMFGTAGMKDAAAEAEKVWKAKEKLDKPLHSAEAIPCSLCCKSFVPESSDDDECEKCR